MEDITKFTQGRCLGEMADTDVFAHVQKRDSGYTGRRLVQMELSTER